MADDERCGPVVKNDLASLEREQHLPHRHLLHYSVQLGFRLLILLAGQDRLGDIERLDEEPRLAIGRRLDPPKQNVEIALLRRDVRTGLEGRAHLAPHIGLVTVHDPGHQREKCWRCFRRDLTIGAVLYLAASPEFDKLGAGERHHEVMTSIDRHQARRIAEKLDEPSVLLGLAAGGPITFGQQLPADRSLGLVTTTTSRPEAA
ncbi:hypothetical protein [Caulobacter radicis]|uniref:hypothetical protein n=1 Tax=Caulobacter radicis TaxID=2172650 RepID=UPI003CC651FD